MRNPIDMTDAEIAYCQDCLPRDWVYLVDGSKLECNASRRGEVLEMKYVKLLTDYLTSINVDPYVPE